MDHAGSRSTETAPNGHAGGAAWLSRLHDHLSRALALLLLATLGLVVAQIAFRFALEVSVPWTEEVSRLLFLYLVYLGAAVALHERAMITIDTLPLLAPRLAPVIEMFARVATILVLAFLLWASVPMIRSSWNTSLSTVAWISNGWAYVAFAVSFALMLAYSVLALALSPKKRRQ